MNADQTAMEHVVFYPAPDGVPGFRRFSSLEEAVGFVEHLRNVEAVEDVSVHTLTPVPVAFRAYYKVEVPLTGLAAPEVPVQPTADLPAALAEMPVESMLEPGLEPVLEPVDAAAGGKRSLGFFAH